MTMFLGVTRALVQFKLSGPISGHNFPPGLVVSVETGEQREVRAARYAGQEGESWVAGRPVCADTLHDALCQAGFVLVSASAQERAGADLSMFGKQSKPHTMLTFAFARTGKPCGAEIVSCLNDHAARIWPQHKRFCHGDHMNLLFVGIGKAPDHYDVGEADEFGVAEIINKTEAHKRAAEVTVAA